MIETVTYIGLLAVIIAIVLPAFYFISSSMDKEKLFLLESEESDFILAKVNGLVSESTAIIEPEPSKSGNTLRLELNNVPGDQVTIGLENGAIFLQRGNGAPKQILNSSRVIISDLTFTYAEANLSMRESVSFSFKIDSYAIATSTTEIE